MYHIEDGREKLDNVTMPDGTMNDAIRALQHIDDMPNPPDIVNMSFGHTNRTKDLDAILNKLSTKTILIAAAGTVVFEPCL